MRLTSLAQVLSFFLLSISTLLSAEQPPNVVLIFVDDLGYGDLGCYGATKVQTPNIDRLAAEGRRFTDAHSVSAVCTPSRYALLTGQYPLRANGGKGIWGPAPVTSPLLVDTERITIADVFKNSGYDTAALGKWHLGFKEGSNDWQEPLRPGPQDLGFDYYFGVPVVNSAPPYVYVENDHVVGGDPADPLVHLGRNAKDTTPITKISPEAAQRSPNQFGGAKEAHKLYNDYQVGTTFAEKSVEWIKERNNRPFFLYLATTNIHHPFTPAKRFQGTSQCGLYGDYIHELDWIVGKILSCLEHNGLSDNTLVILTSDNGGMFNHGGQAAFKAGHRQNGDLLGFKFGVWEGGHRVPFIVRWPGKVKAGTTSNQLIGHVDMLATFAAVTGQKLGKTQQADSVNMLPALVGEPVKSIRDHLVLAPHKGTHLSVRKGKWMYIPRRGSGGFTGKKPGVHTFAGPPAVSFVGSINSDIENGKIKKGAPPAQLYDLQRDPTQTTNVYREHPEVVKELTALLANYGAEAKRSERVASPRKPRKVRKQAEAKQEATSSPTVSIESLLAEMIDRDGVARFPEPNFRLKQQSSYNRASKTPDDPKGWFANSDFNPPPRKGRPSKSKNFIRIEETNGKKEWVLMDHKVPGAIVRAWMPWLNQSKAGTNITMRIYLDGATEPTLEGNMLGMFDGTGFISYPFAHPSLRSAVNFFPIPYAKSCKVTTTEAPFFYQFTFREYDEGTPVKTFTMADFVSAKEQMEATGRILLNPVADGGGNPLRFNAKLGKQEEHSLDLPEGTAAVRELSVRLGSYRDPKVTRYVVLKMEFDGKETVWCPIGDFFGSGIGLNPVQGWYRTVAEDGTMSCRWVMPYQKSGKVSVVNFGDQAVDVELQVKMGAWSWDKRSMYFHAGWRGQYPVPTRPYSDWNYITANGRGVYVGDTLTVMNPVERWWGEGDEKIWVDGEDFPSIFGTGTEDYYAYSWGGRSTDFYEHPFHAQPYCHKYNKLHRKQVDEKNTQGYSTETRSRSLDTMPFGDSLKLDMEVWHWNECDMGYGVGTYWYGFADTKSNRKPEPIEVLNVPPSPVAIPASSTDRPAETSRTENRATERPPDFVGDIANNSRPAS